MNVDGEKKTLAKFCKWRKKQVDEPINWVIDQQKWIESGLRIAKMWMKRCVIGKGNNRPNEVNKKKRKKKKERQTHIISDFHSKIRNVNESISFGHRYVVVRPLVIYIDIFFSFLFIRFDVLYVY